MYLLADSLVKERSLNCRDLKRSYRYYCFTLVLHLFPLLRCPSVSIQMSTFCARDSGMSEQGRALPLGDPV